MEIVKPKIDVVFKTMFTQNPDLLQDFLARTFEMDPDGISDIEIKNCEMPPDDPDEKFSRFDLRLSLSNGVRINVEMQKNRTNFYKNRTLFNWAKLYTDGFKKGEGYGQLKKTVVVNVLDYNLVYLNDCRECHSRFIIYDPKHNIAFGDGLFEMHTLELTKLKYVSNDDIAKDPLLQWLLLINVEKEEDLNMVNNLTNLSAVNKAADVIRTLSLDDRMRELAYDREMAEHDKATVEVDTYNLGFEKGKEKGREEGEKKGEKKGKKNMLDKLAALYQKQGKSEEEIQEILSALSDE